MTTHHSARVRHTVAAGVASAALAFAGSAQPAAAAPAPRVPAKGATVSCDSVGRLTGTGGYLRQRETRTVGRHGHTHVLFTIATDRVRLADRRGRTYHLVGAGYDEVAYPGATVTGTVLHEVEDFRFIVTRRQHVVGVVRFRLHTGADHVTHVHDSSTCRLPHTS